MKIEAIKAMIEAGQLKELCRQFKQIDGKSNSINQWQDIWSLPKQTEGYQLAHKLRNQICSIDSYLNGVEHLNSTKYPALAKMSAQDALNTIEIIQEHGPTLFEVMKPIHAFLYPKY